MAAQELLARTTMPPEVNAPSPTASMEMTSRTPGTAFAFVASNLATLPPKTGQRAMTAYSMAGGRDPVPDLAAPGAFGGGPERLGSGPAVGDLAAVFTRRGFRP